MQRKGGGGRLRKDSVEVWVLMNIANGRREGGGGWGEGGREGGDRGQVWRGGRRKKGGKWVLLVKLMGAEVWVSMQKTTKCHLIHSH